MMTGLAYLKFFSYYLYMSGEMSTVKAGSLEDTMPFDIFNKIARAEWDTLLFFYGVILCVGGLGFIGYLELLSAFAYIDVGPSLPIAWSASSQRSLTTFRSCSRC